MCNVTHKLLVIERCDQTAIHKTCNVTDLLMDIGIEDLMRLGFTKNV